MHAVGVGEGGVGVGVAVVLEGGLGAGQHVQKYRTMSVCNSIHCFQSAQVHRAVAQAASIALRRLLLAADARATPHPSPPPRPPAQATLTRPQRERIQEASSRAHMVQKAALHARFAIAALAVGGLVLGLLRQRVGGIRVRGAIFSSIFKYLESISGLGHLLGLRTERRVMRPDVDESAGFVSGPGGYHECGEHSSRQKDGVLRHPMGQLALEARLTSGQIRLLTGANRRALL